MFNLLAGAVCGACSLVPVHGAPNHTRPNIVFVLTDDQGYGDLGCYGSTEIATPNVDRLAQQGMKFTSFYVHNRCSPTRAALMTGCHAQRVGAGKVIYRRDRMGINPEEITLAEQMNKAGYATGMVGKWHLGEWQAFNPVHHGFDSFYGFMACDDKATAIYRNLDIVEKVKSKTDGVHSPKLLAAGIEFIKANARRPFFLYYASPLPHTKWKPHEDFKGSSKQGTYGDVIQEIDWQVGGLMQTLDDLGLTDNTLVVYTSDNGPQLNVDGHGSAGPLRDGKWTNFEGGIRVPCIMRWPGKIPAGSCNNDITGIIDMLPTFSAIAGIDVPSDRWIDGRSILPYMLDHEVPAPIHESFIVPGSTIRFGDWKLFVSGQGPGGKGNRGDTSRTAVKAGALFNLADDIAETTDLSAEHPEVVRRLEKMMSEFVNGLRANTREIGYIEGYDKDRVQAELKKLKVEKEERVR